MRYGNFRIQPHFLGKDFLDGLFFNFLQENRISKLIICFFFFNSLLLSLLVSSEVTKIKYLD